MHLQAETPRENRTEMSIVSVSPPLDTKEAAPFLHSLFAGHLVTLWTVNNTLQEPPLLYA